MRVAHPRHVPIERLGGPACVFVRRLRGVIEHARKPLAFVRRKSPHERRQGIRHLRLGHRRGFDLLQLRHRTARREIDPGVQRVGIQLQEGGMQLLDGRGISEDGRARHHVGALHHRPHERDALQQRVVGKSGGAFRRQRPDELDRLLRGGRSCEQLAELRHRLELPDGPLPGDLERIILVLARRADRFAPVPDLPSTEPNPNAEADQEQASDGDGDGDPRP